MNHNGYFGNVANPQYNIDINGTIRSTDFRGSGNQLYNVNLRDKSTSELREGTNLYYTDQRVNNFVRPLYLNVMNEVDNLKYELANINLDGIPQGQKNQFIVNNLFNNSLLVNGTLTVRDLRIVDTDDIYTSNLFDQTTSGQSLISYNTSNLIYKFKNSFDNQIYDIHSNITSINIDIEEVRESLFYINLDNTVQGDTNKYIVNDIYNSSLLVNGTLTVRDIRILDVDDTLYSDIYSSNLYNPYSSNLGTSTGSKGIKLLSENNVSNIAIGLIREQVEPVLQGIHIDIDDINTGIISINDEIDNVKEAMYYINLDNIVQGSNNRYIVNNIFNNSLLVNGTLTVRDIRILDGDIDDINDEYNSSLYDPFGSNLNSRTASTGGGIKLLSEQNVSNITIGLLQENMNSINTVLDYLNLTQNTVNNIENNIDSLQENISNIHQVLDYVNSDITDVQNDVADIREAQRFINLDNIVQGSNNQYIVNSIYNQSLLVNGTLTVKDIRILEVDNEYYSDMYASNLYDPNKSIGSVHSYSVSSSMSNITMEILKQKDYENKINTIASSISGDAIMLSNRFNTFNQDFLTTSNNQANEIKMLKNNVSSLTSNLDYVLLRLRVLEALISV
jgi:prefoldin subunit 5